MTFQEERKQAGVDGDWICVGAFAGSHGVRGDVKVKSFTDDPTAIFSFNNLHNGADGPVVKLKKLRATKDGFIGHIDGISTPEEAQLLKSKRLYVPRDAFGAEDEDEFYLADLIALKAIDDSGAEIGFVKAVENFGAEDLLELVLDEPVKGLGKSVFIPFRKALVPTVDIKAGFVKISFDDWQKTQVSERDTDDEGEA